MGRGSKFKGPAPVGAPATSTNATVPTSSKKYPGISDELRQAVLDMGGGEEDFELIDGVDDDEEAEAPVKASKKAQNPEVSLAFMVCATLFDV